MMNQSPGYDDHNYDRDYCDWSVGCFLLLAVASMVASFLLVVQ